MIFLFIIIIIIIIIILANQDELERGDVPKSVQCYMNETGASEEDACEYIRYLISETWKKMNEERDAASPLSETFIEIVFNLGRMAQCMCMELETMKLRIVYHHYLFSPFQYMKIDMMNY